MKLTSALGSALMAAILAVVMLVRMTQTHQVFQKTVRQSLVTTEGYDQKFIDLVNHLEDVLTTRASFSYPGGKDPMTGRQREVAQYVPIAPVKRVASTPRPTGSAAPAPTPPPAAIDPFRLTALIADDYGRYTAIVMDGERSMSVDVGDAVSGRKVMRISSREIVLGNDDGTMTYNLNGERIPGTK